MAPVSGTEGYAEEAEALFRQYESIPFTDAHRAVLHLIPSVPGRVLDIGSGTGRDAAWFAGRGHSVVAVEPTDAMRLPAMALHPSPRIDWLDDSLPDLSTLRGRGETFDLVMLTAVWMHLDEAQRRRAMPRVAALLLDGGIMGFRLRHGPVPPGRRRWCFHDLQHHSLRLFNAALPLRKHRRMHGITQFAVAKRASVLHLLQCVQRDGVLAAFALVQCLGRQDVELPLF